MYDLDVFGPKNVFFFGVSLWEAEKRICCAIGPILVILNAKVISRKLLSSPNLPGTEAFGSYEAPQIVIIHKYQDLILITFQIVVPDLKNPDNTKSSPS